MTGIKTKLKAVLEGEVKVPGNVIVEVELYGSRFSKFQEDGVIRNGIEAGLVLSIPFN